MIAAISLLLISAAPTELSAMCQGASCAQVNAEATARRKAVGRLRSIGKLDDLPLLDSFSSKVEFARALEIHCSAPEGSIRFDDEESVRFSASMDVNKVGVDGFDQGLCVLLGLAAQRDAASRLGLKYGQVNDQSSASESD